MVYDSDKGYLGVGRHSGCGSAQRMYIKRGCLPDGSGVRCGSEVCGLYADGRNDDNRNLYFIKEHWPIILPQQSGLEKNHGRYISQQLN